MTESNTAPKPTSGLWDKILALPPACSIVASLSVVWTLGPVGDWLITYWLPVTRWVWEVTLGRILWFPLKPEQKDVFTLTAFLFPLYWVSRYKPVTPGRQMNRLRLLAMILAIAIIGLMAQSLLRDAGSFFSGGLGAIWQVVLGYLGAFFGAVVGAFGLILMMVTIMSPIGLYSLLEKALFPERSSRFKAPETTRLFTKRLAYHLGLLALLSLACSHLIARLMDIGMHGFAASQFFGSIRFDVYNPSHPVFGAFILLSLIALKKIEPFHHQRPARTPHSNKTRQQITPKPKQPASNEKAKDALFAVLVALVFLFGGYQTVGLPKTLLLLFFAVMIGVIAIRNPHRMIQLGWTVAFILACALGVAAFDQILGMIESASQTAARASGYLLNSAP